MPARGHADHTDLLRIVSALRRVAADEADGALSVLPTAPVARRVLRPRRPVDEIDGLVAERRKAVAPRLDEPDVTAAGVAAARDEDHARAVRLGRFLEPLEVRHTVLLGLEVGILLVPLAARFPGLYLTDRFSPGYGDLPLSLQPGLCAVLDAERRVGIHVTSSFLMNPGKSVTAVIGLADKPQMARIRGCAWCVMRNTCTLRKGGKSCGL